VHNPATMLQHLIRFNSTNPPGNEAECIAAINTWLTDAGFETRVLARDQSRPNLITRLKGRGLAPPLLWYGHVDVVTTEEQQWSVPPFEGRISGGYVWGRGALDMKGGIAMMLTALLRAKHEGLRPAGDVVLCIVSDEEGGGDFGAKFLVEQHAGLFDGIASAIGEFGGFTTYLGSHRFYPIQVAEKQMCVLKATVRSKRGGHGALPVRDGAMAKLGMFLHGLDRRRPPLHVTPATGMMVEHIAAALPFAARQVAHLFTKPSSSRMLVPLLGPFRRMIEPMLQNTATATVVRGGNTVNVVPSTIEVLLDGRLLPGHTPDDLLRELQLIVDDDIEIEVIRYDQSNGIINMRMFDLLAEILKEADPGATPIPMLLSGVTDGRFFSRLGIQTYGFLPMRLPKDFKFAETIHGANERIPVDALDFGTNCLHQLLQRYGHTKESPHD
jgi:acetylornithine deacetylase/succinyl-diaminopimelate desuccinylase-like protein